MPLLRRNQVRKLRGLFVAVAVLAAAGVLQALDANPAASQNQTLTAFAARDDPGLDPTSKAWNDARKAQVALSAQPAAYATGGGSVATVSAQALHFNQTLYLRLEWDDATQDASTARPDEFADAVAVEFPAKPATTVPSICMGQADQGVNIWQWRADSDAGIEAPLAVFNNGFVDWYPDENDPTWFPARAAGNPYANPSAGPVQDLVAFAFGTIGPAPSQAVRGKGTYENGKWAVVFARAFQTADAGQAAFSAGAKMDMAFAVWNGSEDDRDGMKSTSQFVTMSLSAAPLGGAGRDSSWLWLAAGLLAIGVAVGGGLAIIGTRTR